MRKFTFQTGDYYHLYNRGVDKREIFIDDKDYLRFLRSMREFNNDSDDALRDYEKRQTYKKLSFGYPKLSFNLEPKLSFLDMPKTVNFISYCLNPNHHHFLLNQLNDKGIEKFMQKLNTGYTKYFNQKYNRTGSLFESTYKAIRVDDYGYLLKLLVYVNCNHEIHDLGKAKNWVWSNYLDSVGLRNGNLCNLEIIKQEFDELHYFKKFCQEIIPEIKENKTLSKYLLE